MTHVVAEKRLTRARDRRRVERPQGKRIERRASVLPVGSAASGATGKPCSRAHARALLEGDPTREGGEGFASFATDLGELADDDERQDADAHASRTRPRSRPCAPALPSPSCTPTTQGRTRSPRTGRWSRPGRGELADHRRTRRGDTERSGSRPPRRAARRTLQHASSPTTSDPAGRALPSSRSPRRAERRGRHRGQARAVSPDPYPLGSRSGVLPRTCEPRPAFILLNTPRNGLFPAEGEAKPKRRPTPERAGMGERRPHRRSLIPKME